MKIAPEIVLTDEERATLERWSRGRSTPARLVLRSQIVLLAAEGKMNQKIAPRLKTALKTVSLWRRRFAEQRVAGIEKDAPRGGRPKIVCLRQACVGPRKSWPPSGRGKAMA
jgi:DNA-binding CsgD family transcriptional regulator